MGSRPQEPLEAALDEVAKSDCFIGLYAKRYGTIPTDQSISITEQEFDRGVLLNLPCYCI